MNQRASLALAVAGLLLLSGCSGLPGVGTEPPRTTPDSSPTPPLTGTPSLVESGAGDHPHDIVIGNSLDDAVAVTVVAEFNGTEIYRENHTIPADSDATVAGITRRSLPDNAPPLSVTVTDASGQSAGVEVSVSRCLGDVLFYFDDGGDLQGTYSIC